MVSYGLLTLLISVLASPSQQDVSRSYNIIGGFAIIAVIVAAVYPLMRPVTNRYRIHTDYLVKWSHSLCAVGLMGIVIILQLLFLN
jgi:hypothetical protein